ASLAMTPVQIPCITGSNIETDDTDAYPTACRIARIVRPKSAPTDLRSIKNRDGTDRNQIGFVNDLVEHVPGIGHLLLGLLICSLRLSGWFHRLRWIERYKFLFDQLATIFQTLAE